MNYFQLFYILFTILLYKTHQETISLNIQQNNQYQWYYRQLVKIQNTKLIQQHNKNSKHRFHLKPNRFLSMKTDQFYNLYTTTIKIRNPQDVIVIPFSPINIGSTSIKGISSSNTSISTSYQPDQSPSINIDLSPHISPVKDQGKCNSCYAHSTIATVETLLHIKFNETYDLSQQQIADCTRSWAPKGYQVYNNQGCNGGWGWISLYYIKNLGVTYEDDYPYVSKKTGKILKCNQFSITTQRFKISNYEYFYNKTNPQSQCHILNEKLQAGKTIATSIWAPYGIQYQFYGSATPGIDIFTLCGPYDDVNHELQLVGSTDQYWKLKNSYGTDWGEKGFLYLDKSKGLNCLNICLDFSLPLDLVEIKV